MLQKNPDWWRHHNRRQAPTKDGVQYHSIVGRGFTASILEGLEYVVYKNAQTYAGEPSPLIPSHARQGNGSTRYPHVLNKLEGHHSPWLQLHTFCEGLYCCKNGHPLLLLCRIHISYTHTHTHTRHIRPSVLRCLSFFSFVFVAGAFVCLFFF